MLRRCRQSGFTLIELMIVVAIVAIIASIATLTFLTAIERARQKRAVSDIRQVAMAWEARAADVHTYAAAGYEFPDTKVEWEDLTATLAPTYTRSIAQYDSWNHPYEYGVSEEREYAIRSGGKNRSFEGTTYTPGETTDPDCDIVYSNGTFITYPVAVKVQATSTQAPTP